MRNILSYKDKVFSGAEIKEWIDYHSTHETSHSKTAMKMRRFLDLTDEKMYVVYKNEDRNSSSYGSYLVMGIEEKKSLPCPEKFELSWIPCEERQPEKSGNYLVTYERYFCPDHVDQIDHVRDVGIKYYSAKFNQWHTEKVFAWMELPQMYVDYADPDVVNCLNCRFYDPDYHILYEVTGNEEYKDLGYCKQSEKDMTLNQSAGPGLYCEYFKFKKRKRNGK